jgi:branched-chain amino acid transport system substrate-binding protein
MSRIQFGRVRGLGWQRFVSGAAAFGFGVVLVTASLSTDASAATKASGSPVTIGFINTNGAPSNNQPEINSMAEATAKYADANLGGVAGHPIKLIPCNGMETAASETACANEMVDDHVSAVAIGAVVDPAAIIPIVTGAGIPLIANDIQGVGTEGDTADSYGFGAGDPGYDAGFALYGKQHHWKSFTYLELNVPTITSNNPFLTKLFASEGIKLNVALFSPTTTDMLPTVTAALQSDPSGIGIIAGDTQCIPYLQALGTLNSTVPHFLTNACTDKSVFNASPSGFASSLVANGWEVGGTDAEAKLYDKIAKTAVPSVDPNSYAPRGYQVIMDLVRSTAHLKGTVTPESIRKAIATASALPLAAGDGSTYICNGKVISELSSMCNDKVFIQHGLASGNLKPVEALNSASLIKSALQ